MQGQQTHPLNASSQYTGQMPTLSLNMICTQQHLFFPVMNWLPRKLLPLQPHLCKCYTTSRPDTNVSPTGSCPKSQPDDLLCPLISLHFLFPLQILSKTTWNGYLCLCLFFFLYHIKKYLRSESGLIFEFKFPPWYHECTLQIFIELKVKGTFDRNNPF